VKATALFALLVLAACSHEPKPSMVANAEKAFDELRAAVAREIKDPARAKQSIALVDEMDQLVAAADRERKLHEARLRALNESYDSTLERFRGAFRDYNALRNDWQARTLELNLRAKTLVTPAEWQALAKVREQAARRAAAIGAGL
jgi:hypothetical protein